MQSLNYVTTWKDDWFFVSSTGISGMLLSHQSSRPSALYYTTWPCKRLVFLLLLTFPNCHSLHLQIPHSPLFPSDLWVEDHQQCWLGLNFLEGKLPLLWGHLSLEPPAQNWIYPRVNWIDSDYMTSKILSNSMILGPHRSPKGAMWSLHRVCRPYFRKHVWRRKAPVASVIVNMFRINGQVSLKHISKAWLWEHRSKFQNSKDGDSPACTIQTCGINVLFSIRLFPTAGKRKMSALLLGRRTCLQCHSCGFNSTTSWQFTTNYKITTCPRKQRSIYPCFLDLDLTMTLPSHLSCSSASSTKSLGIDSHHFNNY